MNKLISYSSGKVLRNSALSLAYKVITVLLSFISAPLLLSVLGENKYGVWVTLLSIVSWIYYLDIGIGNGLRIRLSESLARGDEISSKKLIGSSYMLLSIIAGVAFLLSVLIIEYTNTVDRINVPQEINENVKMILIIAISFVCINFVLSLINPVLYSVQRASTVSALSIIGQIIFIIGLLIYDKSGKGLIVIVAGIEGVSQLIKNIIGSIWIHFKYPVCRISIENPMFAYQNGIVSFGIQTFVISIAALVLNATDNLLIMQFFGAEEVTPYYFCYKYFSMLTSSFAVIVVPFQSAYTMARVNDDIEWIKKSLKRAFILFIFFSIGAVIAVCVFKPFSLIWLKKELEFKKGLISCVALYSIILMLGHVLSTFTAGIGRIKESIVVGIFQAIINIPVSLLFAVKFNMGVNGIILGSVVSVTLGVMVVGWATYDEIKRMRD